MELKRCPVCEALVFEDMEICYECMYRFGSDPEREAAANGIRAATDGSAAASCTTEAGIAPHDAQTVKVGGWDVRLAAAGAASEIAALHIIIEPTLPSQGARLDNTSSGDQHACSG